MRILCLAIATLWTVSAQQFPDAAALLTRSADALKTYSAFEYSEDMTGPVGGMQTTMRHQGTNSGKMRMSQKFGDIEGLLIVSDGRDMWMYMGTMKRYMKIPANPALMGVLAGTSVTSPAEAAGESSKVIRAETIEVDGEPHDCWVVESRLQGSSTPGAQVKAAITRHWIDKISSLEFKTTVATVVQTPGNPAPVETNITVLRHGYKFNPPLDDALFVFTPPAGATETDELFPGMKASFSKSEEPSAPVVTEAQAFVPNLRPIERVEAVRPKVMADDRRAEVEFLLTIDPAGGVINAEVLAGPEALHKSATDAVMQWKFHPVIRNGAPVFAYTDATVDFTDFSKPIKPVAPDMAGAMDTLKRVQALEARFPRTPQQELADLEQDLSGVTGEDRTFALPRLAKAALKAEAFDKAADYANELLRSSSTDGQAVHDGNMVLGMIALRQGDVPAARRHLLASAKTTGSPVLSSFGPNMLLAKSLLEHGERDVVIEYFDSCRSFWKMGSSQLDVWTEAVRQGGMPSFGANLLY